MKRLILGSLALLVAVVAAPAAPVQADPTYGWTSAPSGVLYDDCRDYGYQYSLNVPAAAVDWTLEVTLFEPDGSEGSSDFLYDGGNPTSGADSFYLCPPSDLYGGYRITATFKWLDSSYNATTSQLNDSYFTLRKPYSATSLALSTRRPAYRQVVAFRTSARDERPAGYFGASYATVYAQKKVDGHWVTLKGSRTTTDSTGHARVRLRYMGHHRRTWIRAVTAASSTYEGSVSVPVRIW